MLKRFSSNAFWCGIFFATGFIAGMWASLLSDLFYRILAG